MTEPLYFITSIYTINPIYRNRLYQLINKFTYKYSKKDVEHLYHLIQSNEPDHKIIEYVISRKSTIKEITMDSKKRGDKFATEWSEIIPKGKYTNYLDVGCNTGSITVPFGTKLGLKSANIYGIDITNFGAQTIKPLPGFTYTQYDGYHIPHPDEKFDIITCSMVLHHVKYPQILLPEIRRVMKLGGIILIKEHNAYAPQLEWLIELEHLLYEVTESNTTYDEFKKNYYQKLFTRETLDDLMLGYGFEKKDVDSERIIRKYYVYNPTKNFYQIYIKKSI